MKVDQMLEFEPTVPERLHCGMHCAGHFIYTVLIFITPLKGIYGHLMSNLRFREIKQLAQNHTSSFE